MGDEGTAPPSTNRGGATLTWRACPNCPTRDGAASDWTETPLGSARIAPTTGYAVGPQSVLRLVAERPRVVRLFPVLRPWFHPARSAWF